MFVVRCGGGINRSGYYLFRNFYIYVAFSQQYISLREHVYGLIVTVRAV